VSVQAALERLAAHPAPLPVRRTERLVLRPFRESDREPFAALNADPEVMEHMLHPLDRTESDVILDRFRVDAARRGFGMFAVEERETRTFVGAVGLGVPRWDTEFMPAVEIGWRLARSAWGRGYATEAARDVLAWAFGPLALPRVVSFTSPVNVRSWRVMERIGMARVGEFGHPGVPADHSLHTHLLYAMDAPSGTAGAGDARPLPARPAPAKAEPPPPIPPRLDLPVRPRVWLDGDGCPRVIKEIVWRAVERGAIEVTIVANRPLTVPRSAYIRTVVVKHGLDVADDWLVANASPGELVVTSDVPLAAELVAKGVVVVSPRGERFTPSNMGEKLSLRDFFTEARASGLVEGGGPAGFDERAKREFAAALDQWLNTQKRAAPRP